MDRDPSRKEVDLSKLPAWARWSLALATIALVVGLAMLVAKPVSGPMVLIPAIVGALIAFAIIAWRAQRH